MALPLVLPLSIAQIVALSLGLVGVVLGFAAILTPGWQVVYAREIQQWVQSGLWLNCQTRPNGMYTCAYVFSDSDFNFYTSAELLNMRTPPFYAWQRHLLFVFLLGQLAAFVALFSLCLSFHPPTRRFSALAFIACMALAVLIHTGATISFAILSQMVEYRFFHVSVSGIYEKHRGYSFFLECAAVLSLLASLVPAIVHLVRLRPNNSASSQPDKPQNYLRNSPPFSRYPHHHPLSSSTASQLDDQWEARFAMRELPPLPPVANFRWAD